MTEEKKNEASGMTEKGKTELSGKADNREMTCICCPLGCALTVFRQENGEITVTGNTCPRGAEYGVKELTNPTRTVTTTVRVKGRENCMVPVKTTSEVPKAKIMDCMKAIAGVEVSLPVKIGDVVLKNAAGTGVDVAATRNVSK